MAKRKHRMRIVVLVVAVLVVGAAALVLRGDPAPVGHFRSAEGYDRFMATYDTAMEGMPGPEQTLDLRTGFGIARLYRFSGADTARPPIVLLPGTASATPMWDSTMASMLRQSDVYTLDMIGEPGRSIQDRPISNPDEQSAWLGEVLAQLPEPEVIILGTSLGGWNVINHVVHTSDKIAGAVLIDPAGSFADLSVEVIFRSIPASVPAFPRSWRDDFNSWTAGGAPVEGNAVADMIEAGMQGYATKLPPPAKFTPEQLGRIEVPMLVIMAGRSVMHDSAAAAETARDQVRNVTVKTYPEASHAITGEYPEQLAADVGTFAAGLS